MNDKSKRFRIGVFVLGTMFLLAVLIMLFGAFPGFLTRHDRYRIVFDSAPGAAAGTPVRRSGVRIGQVEKVELDDRTGKVVISILIDKPHPLFQNDRPQLVHGLLSGDTSIDFVSPKPGGKPVELVEIKPGTELTGDSQADVSLLLNQTSEMVPVAQDALNDIRKVMQRFENSAPLMEETLREYRDLGKVLREAVPEVRELAKLSRETIPDLKKTNDEIQVTARNWGKVGERVDLLLQTNQDKLVKTLDDLNDTLVRIGRVFNDENQKNLSTTLKNVSDGSKNLESITRNTDQFLKESRLTMKQVGESVAKVDEVLVNLQQATKPMADRSANTMKNLEESTEKLNRMAGEGRELMRMLGQGDGTFRRLLEDPTLYNNLNDLMCAMARELPRIDRILHDVEVFADKIARHPESLGVRGAVAPGSGLKEAPAGASSRPRILPSR